MHPDVVWELPEGYPGGGNYYGIDEVFNSLHDSYIDAAVACPFVPVL